MDIEQRLAERAKRIDALIAKYVPRAYTNETLEHALGMPRFAHSPAPATAALAQPIWELLDRGGKRWRPALFLMVAEALGAPPEYDDLAVLVEVVHNGSLMVDDIEDRSDLRRGKPAIHRVFGEDIAINAGSAMYYLPLLALLRNEWPTDIKLRIYETYAQELIAIHFGQAMDIAWHRGLADANDITENEYLQMCVYKTGTLARLAAKLGAIVAHANEETIDALGAFAETLGIGFQIRDDILNLTATSGRNQFVADYVGSDITEGKRTLMVVHAIEHSPQRGRLIEILGTHTADKNEIAEAIAILRDAGSVEYAISKGQELVTNTWKTVDAILPDSDAKEELAALARFAMERGY